MAYFDALLQQAITVRNNRAPASNTADLVGGVLVAIVTALQMLLDDKQDSLTFDTTPTADSPNPVTSDGIYQALQAIDLSACEKIVNKVTSINAQSTDVQYPTAKLLYDSLQALSGIYAAIQHTHAIADIINLQTELNARQLVSNLVTAITAQSTDLQYPSAKLLYDQLQGLAAVYAPKVHTHPFADIERPANVATVTAQGYTITTAYYSHILTITADTTLHLPAMLAAIIMRLTIIQDATGGRAVTFDGGAVSVYNPQQVDLSQGAANQRCWVTLLFDGAQWAYWATPYILRPEGSFDYYLYGTSLGSVVNVTINGSTMQLPVNSGQWEYGYNAASPITAIAFTGDSDVTTIDFTSTDGLATLTSLADAFKNCTALVSVDFTGCDLSNVATAADCFAGCASLAALTIPTGTWKPDIDLSACAAFTKAAMLAVIDGLYTYNSGTHTITFNSTIWDALPVADQQQVFNAADAKGWTTNAVAVTYVIRGTSSNVNGTETFNIQFIQDGALSPDAAEKIKVAVDGNGNFEYSYVNKQIYSLDNFCHSNTTLTSIELTENMTKCVSAVNAFADLSAITSITLNNAIFDNLTTAYRMFQYLGSGMTSLSLPNATFAAVTYANDNANVHFSGMFARNDYLQTISLPKATFASCVYAQALFESSVALTTINMPKATFASATTIEAFALNCKALTTLTIDDVIFGNVTDMSSAFEGSGLTALSLPNATFASVTEGRRAFFLMDKLASLSLPNATFASLQNGGRMFSVRSTSAPSLTIDLSSATFASLLLANNDNNNIYGGMFCQNANLTSLSLPNATFASLTNGLAMFYNTKFTTLSMPNATFAAVTNTTNLFGNCTSLTTLSLPTATALLPTIAKSFTLQNSPLSYASFVAVANWLKDLTGGTAQTITFKTSAWNALSTAEQNNIDTILSGKNWTRAIS